MASVTNQTPAAAAAQELRSSMMSYGWSPVPKALPERLQDGKVSWLDVWDAAFVHREAARRMKNPRNGNVLFGKVADNDFNAEKLENAIWGRAMSQGFFSTLAETAREIFR